MSDSRGGREVDERIEVAVFGMVVFPYEMPYPKSVSLVVPADNQHFNNARPPRRFSTDPAAMVALIGKMREMDWCFRIMVNATGGYVAEFWSTKGKPGRGSAPTMMEAVALAAVAAVGEKG